MLSKTTLSSREKKELPYQTTDHLSVALLPVGGLMINKAVNNRPFKFGERDRREFIVQESEVAFIAINNTEGNPIFIGRAKVGVQPKENKWQIRKITYDLTNGVSRIKWPKNNENNASADFEFIWSSYSPLKIINISQANPAVVTVSHMRSLKNGDRIILQGVVGMADLNYDDSNIYTVDNITKTTFQLQDINSTDLTAYKSGGTVEYGEVIGYVYT